MPKKEIILPYERLVQLNNSTRKLCSHIASVSQYSPSRNVHYDNTSYSCGCCKIQWNTTQVRLLRNVQTFHYNFSFRVCSMRCIYLFETVIILKISRCQPLQWQNVDTSNECVLCPCYVKSIIKYINKICCLLAESSVLQRTSALVIK